MSLDLYTCPVTPTHLWHSTNSRAFKMAAGSAKGGLLGWRTPGVNGNASPSAPVCVTSAENPTKPGILSQKTTNSTCFSTEGQDFERTCIKTNKNQQHFWDENSRWCAHPACSFCENKLRSSSCHLCTIDTLEMDRMVRSLVGSPVKPFHITTFHQKGCLGWKKTLPQACQQNGWCCKNIYKQNVTLNFKMAWSQDQGRNAFEKLRMRPSPGCGCWDSVVPPYSSIKPEKFKNRRALKNVLATFGCSSR